MSHHLVDADVIAPDIVDAICQSQLVKASQPVDSGQCCMTLTESLSLKADAVPESYISEDHLPVVPALSHSSLKEKQRADPSIRELIHQMETGEKVPPTARVELPELALLLREWTRLELIDGVLYRKRHNNAALSYQLVLPDELRPFVLKSLHNDMGHLGIDRTRDLVRAWFYWPRMAVDAERKIRTSGRCVRRKARPERSAPFVNITTSRPLELLCMDFLSLEPDSSNARHILVLTDHFTKFTVALPTPNQKAKTVAKCLWDNFIVYFGIPELQETKHKSHSKYIQGLKSCLEESFKIASENALKSAERNKIRFDQRIVPAALEVGDRVLVRNVRLRGKHSLTSGNRTSLWWLAELVNFQSTK